MQLKNVRVTEFQNVLDSTPFEIGDITCLVGKNEAGKTALLQALYRLNPIIEEQGIYRVVDDYPRWNVEDYRIALENGERQPALAIHAVFELEDDDAAEIAKVFGEHALTKRSLTLEKGYEGIRHFNLEVEVAACLQHLAAQKQLKPEVRSQLESCVALPSLVEALTKAEKTQDGTHLLAFAETIQKSRAIDKYIFDYILAPRIPKFLYFDEYYQMKGCSNIEALKQRVGKKTLEPADLPLLGLINLAHLNLDELDNPTRTRDLKNRLERAGNRLTQNVVKYWSQNQHLRLLFDVRPARPEDPPGMRYGTNIWGEVFDAKHMVTTELGSRSRGFISFFSFLAWYSEVQRENKHLILLLDEPGLFLHAKAQADLLHYFETEIKGIHQLIYTTHSPFMVDPAHFDRVRIVRDLSIETAEGEELAPEKQGTKVLTNVLEATGDSLFPLQGALGYEIHQTLFVGPNSLAVEGVSDLIYIQAISALLQERGRTGLSAKWTITPVGGSDKVPAFVALVGAPKKLNVAALIDFQKKDRETLEDLYKRKLLAKQQILTFADFVFTAEADIEDMFEPDFYLAVVNAEYALRKPVKEADLNNQLPRIVSRLERYFSSNSLTGGAFNTYRPARYFAEKIGSLRKNLADTTLDRFEAAFKRLNTLL